MIKLESYRKVFVSKNIIFVFVSKNIIFAEAYMIFIST